MIVSAEILEAKNKDQKLCLRRELIYRRSIQSDEWALIFFSEIAQDFDSSDILKKSYFEKCSWFASRKFEKMIQFWFNIFIFDQFVVFEIQFIFSKTCSQVIDLRKTCEKNSWWRTKWREIIKNRSDSLWN